MKNILFISFLLLVGCNTKTENKIIVNTKGLIGIVKTEQGYGIYSNQGELILEYTKQNCDSLSLETLDEIYQTAKEFYNKEPSKEKEIQTIKHSSI